MFKSRKINFLSFRERLLSHTLLKRAGIVPIALAVSTFGAHAQEAEDQNAETEVQQEETKTSKRVFAPIVVTAEKKEENIQDVGISITAFDGSQLEALGYTNAQQVTALAPGVSTIQPNGEANYAVSMRGAANSDFATNVESPVALYVDEVYISQSSGSGFALFDTDRVEMLRGPQGTLFGRNATGGLVHYISVKPEMEEFGGYGDISYGSFQTLGLEGAVNVPLGDKLASRISVATKQGDGYVTNRLHPESKLNNSNEFASRVQFLLEPTQNFDALVSGRYGKQDIRTGFFNFANAPEPTGQVQQGAAGPAQLGGYTDNDGDIFSGDYNRVGHNKLETYGLSLTMNWDIGDITVTSISDFQSVERDYIEDSDASPEEFFNLILVTDAEQYSQELRIAGGGDKFNWVAGAYFLNIEIDDRNGAIADGFIDTFFELVGFGDFVDFSNGIVNPYQQESQSLSGFFQADYQISDQLKITGGARLIQEEKSFHYESTLVQWADNASNGLAPFEPFDTNFPTFDGQQDDDMWSARVQLNYEPTDDVLAYLSWNRGVRAGGFNAPFLPGADFASDPKRFLQYDPETLNAYELGVKWEFPDGRSRINASVYHYDYEDYQAFSIIGLDSFTLNANSENRGGEVEFQTSPIDGLDILIGIGYVDAKVTDVAGVTEDVVIDGATISEAFLAEARPVQTPEWDISGLLRYEFPISAWDGNMSLQTDISYRSEHFFSMSQAQAVTEDGYTLANASIGWVPDNADWELRLSVNNITDEEYLVQTFDLSGELATGGFFGMIEQYYGRPRTWTASIKWDF